MTFQSAEWFRRASAVVLPLAILPWIPLHGMDLKGMPVPIALHQGHVYFPDDPYKCTGPNSLSGPPTLKISAHLLDGTVMKGESQICRDSEIDTMRVNLPEGIFHPEDTRFLDVEGWKGLPHGQVWTFPVVEGRITAFRMQPDSHGNRFDYLQWEDNPLEPYGDSLLAFMVRDHHRASGLMARKKWGFGSLVGSAMAAGALFMVAATLPGKEYKDERGAVYRTNYRANGICAVVGIGTLLGGIGFWSFTRNNYIQALQSYNQVSP